MQVPPGQVSRWYKSKTFKQSMEFSEDCCHTCAIGCGWLYIENGLFVCLREALLLCQTQQF